MSKGGFRKIAVIGLGLIGSSLVRVASEAKLADEIKVYDRSDEVRAKAIQLGLGDTHAATAAAAAEDADLVVLAVPVGAMGAVAEEIRPALKPGAVVIDTGSTKGSVMRDVKPFLPVETYFVPTHPIAGTEYSGPEAGFSALFRDRYWIVLPEDNPPEVVERIRAFLTGTGALVEDMTVEYHDRVLAITSHLPHLIAYTIVGTAFDFEQQIRNDVIRFSASGFRDFTRIAASDPVMWRDVFLNNSDAVLEMLGRFNEDLSYLQRAIRWKEGDKLEELFSRTREIRNRIKDIGQLD
ncbi:prephenate/arogenate dehydrogenase family protein [Alphaproteobacteria bacterium LSUCC0684]